MHALPEWWSDVHRACDNALSDYERVLNSLERALSDSTDSSESKTAVSRKNISYWEVLNQTALTASSNLKNSFHLAESRRSDIRAMGLAVPEDSGLMERSAAASAKSKKLFRKLHGHMRIIMDEMTVRKPRPPVLNLYSSNSPSYIDVRV